MALSSIEWLIASWRAVTHLPPPRSSYQFLMASLIWTLAVLSCTVYLQFALRCPVCKQGFGIAEKCRSCNLPWHRDPSELFAANPGETHYRQLGFWQFPH